MPLYSDITAQVVCVWYGSYGCQVFTSEKFTKQCGLCVCVCLLCVSVTVCVSVYVSVCVCESVCMCVYV